VEAGTESSLDGESLVAERCTGCHTAERIDAADKDEAGWTKTVDQMIGYGTQLDQAERQAVIDYLVATH
jgi:mono/diheme cytochrome c family protein